MASNKLSKNRPCLSIFEIIYPNMRQNSTSPKTFKPFLSPGIAYQKSISFSTFWSVS